MNNDKPDELQKAIEEMEASTVYALHVVDCKCPRCVVLKHVKQLRQAEKERDKLLQERKHLADLIEWEQERDAYKAALEMCARALQTIHKFESETRIVYFYNEETEEDSLPFNLAEAYQESDMCDEATKALANPTVQQCLKGER